MSARIALVLAGGHGARLWPLSTPRHPKPFRALFEAEPPVVRVLRQSEAWAAGASSVWLAIGEAQREAARAAIPDLDRYTVFPETKADGTTTVIARAALAIARRAPDAVLAVLAADQRVGPDAALFAALDRATDVATKGPWLVSLGVVPDRPDTAYGYMQLGEPIAGASGAFVGEGYVEKPDARTAAKLVLERRSAWNVGLFVFRVDTLLAALRRHAPDVLDALEAGREPGRAVRAIDYELMERVAPGDAERHAFVVADCAFHDFGNLAALANAAPADERGNRVRGDAVAEGCDGCTLLSEAPRRLAVGGLHGAVVAVGAEGNVLVSAIGASDERTTVKLLTRGDGCFAEVRTRGIDVDLDVRVAQRDVSVAPRVSNGRASAPKAIELRVCDDEAEVARASAGVVALTLRAAIARRGRAVWIASTGRTVVGCYSVLADEHARAIDWAKVEVIQMDELADQPAHLTARHFLMHRLIEPLRIVRHALMGDASAATAERVERRAIEACPDLALHGIGENGHLGLNEPGSAFDTRAREAILTEETRRAKSVTTARGCTLGLGALFAVPRNVLVVTGGHKADALHRALFGPATPDVPASGLQLHGATTVIADRAAFPSEPCGRPRSPPNSPRRTSR